MTYCGTRIFRFSLTLVTTYVAIAVDIHKTWTTRMSCQVLRCFQVQSFRRIINPELSFSIFHITAYFLCYKVIKLLFFYEILHSNVFDDGNRTRTLTSILITEIVRGEKKRKKTEGKNEKTEG